MGIESRRLRLGVIASAALVVAAFVLSTWWNVIQDRDLTRSGDATAAEALAISVAEHFEETLRDAGNAVYSAALLIEGNGGPKALADRAWLHRELRRELSDHTSIARMTVVDRDGRVLASSAEPAVDARAAGGQANLPWHAAHPGNAALRLGVTQKSAVDGRYVIPYSRALQDRAGGLIGVVVAEIDLENLRRFHERIDRSYPSSLLLINAEQVRLLRFPFAESLIGRPIRTEIPFAALREMPHPTLEAVSEADGRTYIFSASRTKDRSIMVVVGRERERVLAAWRERAYERAAAAGMGSLMVVALAALLLRYLRRLDRSEASLRDSEEQIRSISNNLPDGMIYRLVRDAAGERRFVYVSAAVEKMHGFTARMVMEDAGCLYRQVIAQDRPLLEAAEEASRHTLSVFHVVARMRHPDGTLRHMRLISAPQRLADGGVRWDGIELDATGLHLAEAALKASETRYRSAMQHLPVGMALIGLDLRWLEVNPALCAMFGYGAAELCSTSILAVNHPEDMDIGRDLRERLLAGTIEDYQIQKRVIRKDGRVILVQINASLSRGLDGAPLHVVSQIQDITERHEAAERIRTLNLELEARVQERTAELTRVNADLEAFSYSVAHDLRAPLHRIGGYAGLLREDLAASGETAQRDIGVIEREVHRMGDLITDLLSLARTSRAELRLAPVTLAPLVTEVHAQLAAETIGREIEWRIDLPVTLHGDAGLLRQVFENLLRNAVKYTGKRERARIEVVLDPARAGQREAVVAVRDNGAGFDMRYAQRLFHPFQRLHRSTDFEGTGVGLAIVQRIVERHGGRIWAEAEPDRGATFFLALPLAVPEDAARPPAGEVVRAR